MLGARQQVRSAGSPRRVSGHPIALLAAVALIPATLCTSCAKNPAAPDPNYPVALVQLDFPEAWSHDGKLIAFRRPYFTSYGASGIYLISPAGGAPRWLYGANWVWPERLRFSPDDANGYPGMRFSTSESPTRLPMLLLIRAGCTFWI